MKVPTIFKGKTCKCGCAINDQSVREIGIDFNTEQFLLRFTCSECGFNGKLVFKTENRRIEDLCAEIANVTESAVESSTESVKRVDDGQNIKIGRSKEELFCNHFDQNKLGCLFIPEWTDEKMREFESVSELP